MCAGTNACGLGNIGKWESAFAGEPGRTALCLVVVEGGSRGRRRLRGALCQHQRSQRSLPPPALGPSARSPEQQQIQRQLRQVHPHQRRGRQRRGEGGGRVRRCGGSLEPAPPPFVLLPKPVPCESAGVCGPTSSPATPSPHPTPPSRLRQQRRGPIEQHPDRGHGLFLGRKADHLGLDGLRRWQLLHRLHLLHPLLLLHPRCRLNPGGRSPGGLSLPPASLRPPLLPLCRRHGGPLPLDRRRLRVSALHPPALLLLLLGRLVRRACPLPPPPTHPPLAAMRRVCPQPLSGCGVPR